MTNQMDTLPQSDELMSTDNSFYRDQYQSLQRLRSNPDFINVIEKGYIEQKALDQVSLLAEPAIVEGKQRADCIEQLIAISHLQYHLKMLHVLGANAEDEYQEAITGIQE